MPKNTRKPRVVKRSSRPFTIAYQYAQQNTNPNDIVAELMKLKLCRNKVYARRVVAEAYTAMNEQFRIPGLFPKAEIQTYIPKDIDTPTSYNETVNTLRRYIRQDKVEELLELLTKELKSEEFKQEHGYKVAPIYWAANKIKENKIAKRLLSAFKKNPLGISKIVEETEKFEL